MAYEQYTRCVEPANWKPRSYWIITLQSLVLAPFATVLALGMAKPWCLLIVLEITGLAWVIAYCRHFLYHRLICLGGDRDVIGAIVSVSPPPAFTELDWDNDYSINLLLQNTEFGVTQEQAAESQPYGFLVAAQDVVTNPPVSQLTRGHSNRDEFGTGKPTANLHAEFEGAGNYDLLQISQGMLAFAIAALLACVFLPWPADLIVAIGLAALALLGWLVGAILAKTVRPGSPSDVDPDIGTLHPNDDAGEDGLGRGADIVYVQGTWVFDPLHDGWNEIHPIKVCTIVGKWDGAWPEQQPDVILRARHAFEVARADETQANQKRPEHQWQVHPDIDGCDPVVID
jgi:hypothetical protein